MAHLVDVARLFKDSRIDVFGARFLLLSTWGGSDAGYRYWLGIPPKKAMEIIWNVDFLTIRPRNELLWNKLRFRKDLWIVRHQYPKSHAGFGKASDIPVFDCFRKIPGHEGIGDMIWGE